MKTQRILTTLLIVMLPIALFAHAPKKVNLSYNNEAGILSASILHPVKNVEDHFIVRMIVTVNDKEVETLEYTVQSSLESHEVEINLPGLKSGDVVSVKATCNKVGSKTRKLEIK